jgi:hypothetical protein
VDRDPVTDAYIALWLEDKLLLHEENIHIGVYTANAGAQLQSTSPGVLCKEEMEAAAPQSDHDSAATEDGILPYMVKRSQSPVREVIAHPAEQLVPSPKAPKPETVEGAAEANQREGGEFELYRRWNVFQVQEKELESRGRTSPVVPRIGGKSPFRRTASSASTTTALTSYPASTAASEPAPLLAQVSLRSPRSTPNRRQNSEEKSVLLCRSFMTQSLLPMGPKIEMVCSGSLNTKYITAGNRLFLKTSLQRITNFLATLDNNIGKSTVSNYSVDAQRLIQDCRARCNTILAAIDATMRELGVTMPSVIPTLMDLEDDKVPSMVHRSASRTRLPHHQAALSPSSRNSPMKAGGNRQSPARQQSPRPRSPARTSTAHNSPSRSTRF